MKFQGIIAAVIGILFFNTRISHSQEQSLTQDVIDQLVLVESLGVGDIVDIAFDENGQHFVVGSKSAGLATYDLQQEQLIVNRVLC